MERILYRISLRLAHHAELDDDQREVIEYALIWIGNTLLGFSGYIVFGALLGILPALLGAGLTAALFRSLSGGAHYSSVLRCALLSIVTMTLLGIAADRIATLASSDTLLVAAALTVVIGLPLVQRYAPAVHPSRPVSPDERLKFRRLSLLFTGVAAALISGVVLEMGEALRWGMLLGYVWQLLTLTPLGHQWVEYFDSLGSIERRKSTE